jgi:hypothetical protein
MSENIDSIESTEVSAPEAVEVETVFFVIKDKDGQFKVVTDIGQKLKLDRVANISDIRMGCQEISRALDIRQTAETVVNLLNAKNTAPAE